MMAHRTFWLFVLVPALLLYGCRKGPDEARGAKVRTETVEGVTLVHNPPEPLNPRKTVRFEEEVSFGAEESGPGAVYKPGQFATDGRNRVYIFEYSESVIKVFGEDGKFLKTIGRKGQGPGEFGQALFIGFCPDGRILVTDSQNRRTSFFGPEGDFLASYQWKTNIAIAYLILDNASVVQESIFEAGKSRVFLKTYDFAGTEVKSWGEFFYPETKAIIRGEMAITVGIPYSPRSVLTGDQTLSRIYHCRNDAYLIEVFDADGRIFRKIDRPYERLPFTDADRVEYTARTSGPKELADIYKDMPWPKVKTVTERMLCDDRGSLWVATNETKDEGGRKLTAYDVFDAEGRYDARVWLDFTPMRFAAGKMYRYKEDPETGVRVLTRYQIVWE
ncbi:MAG: 6-bladed beta-propeller [Candidatus Aminicenantales bacterium]